MRIEPASDYPWLNERRRKSVVEPAGRRLHWAVILAVVCSLIVHVVLVFLFSDIRVAFSGLAEREPLAFNMPRVEVTQESLRPPSTMEIPHRLDAGSLPELVEEKELDLTALQDQIPDDREIAITPEVKRPENLASGVAAAGLALESLNLESFESTLESLSSAPPRVPDLGPVVSENQPIILADPEGESGGKTRDLLEKAAQGNQGISDKFSTLDELMDLGGGKITDITKPIYMPSDLLFDFNEDRLRESAKTSLMMLGILIDRNPQTLFVIEGHTDGIGGDAENLDLSRRRAMAVATWLQQSLRISPARTRIEGFGESRPLVPIDGSIEEQQPNRRVEIRMLRPEGAPAPLSPAKPIKPSVLGGGNSLPPASPDNQGKPPSAPPVPPVRPAVPVPEPELPPVRPARPIEEPVSPPALPARIIEP